MLSDGTVHVRLEFQMYGLNGFHSLALSHQQRDATSPWLMSRHQMAAWPQ